MDEDDRLDAAALRIDEGDPQHAIALALIDIAKSLRTLASCELAK